MERLALYNALRMNWILDPTIQAESWQIQNYRELSTEELFDRLHELEIDVDQEEFHEIAEEAETPEELTDDLAGDFNVAEQDQAYLLIFELWRRLVPEKLTASVFCDELDRQIFLYDQDFNDNHEQMEDILANLKMLFDDYADQGLEPVEIFETITKNCANDIENFLYDFIGEQINNGNNAYAAELIESFSEYVPNTKWFDVFQARLLANEDPQEANRIIRDLVKDIENERDLEFNFALLMYLAQYGDQGLFFKLVSKTVPLLEVEEDFQELLTICAEYYRLLDKDQNEEEVKKLLRKRGKVNLEAAIDLNDPDFTHLTTIMR